MTIEQHPSPNYNYRPANTPISMIVLHATANSTLDGLTSWFVNPASQVSAHYGVGKDGKIIQYVLDHLRAWHAGTSHWKGVDGCNDFSIGIEMVNLNDGNDPYPADQVISTLHLCRILCMKYPIANHDIVAHYEISPGRKSDPKGFHLPEFRYQLERSLRGDL